MTDSEKVPALLRVPGQHGEHRKAYVEITHNDGYVVATIWRGTPREMQHGVPLAVLTLFRQNLINALHVADFEHANDPGAECDCQHCTARRDDPGAAALVSAIGAALTGPRAALPSDVFVVYIEPAGRIAGWMVDDSRTQFAPETRELFGTNAIPMPFTAETRAADVVDVLKRMYPGCSVEVRS